MMGYIWKKTRLSQYDNNVILMTPACVTSLIYNNKVQHTRNTTMRLTGYCVSVAYAMHYSYMTHTMNWHRPLP